jgi:two-component system, NtrC family, nitrogen regulation sensor histidine kinase NtrY
MRYFNRYEYQMAFRVALLFLVITGCAYFLVTKAYVFCMLCGFGVIYQTILLINFVNKTNLELTQFIEAVQYRDFSLLFNEKNAPLSVKSLRKAFNTINFTFKTLSSEKEAQYLYLQKLLEIVDTGILSYNEAGEIKWINESLKKMLDVPYLKTIQSLEKRNPELFQAIIELKVSDNELFKLNGRQILLAKTSFIENGELSQLVAFQNVNEAMDEAETTAWQKLLRVMTHEIMNSVAPIASLADTLQKRLEQKDEHQFQDLEQGMEVIKKRSEGLLRFAKIYRNFSKINEASFTKIYVHELFDNLETLMAAAIQERNIQFEVILKDPHIQIIADFSLIEQVLINLIINAIEAVRLTSDPKIIISAISTSTNKVLLEVTDNGQGIEEEALEQIFVPFFTTKKNGSGIGLSLSKQILTLHKGSIKVKSKVGVGTTFSLEL